MGIPYIIPLSATSRFLATQLSTENCIPHIILPKNNLKYFLKNGSSISYNNQISSSNYFKRTHKFPSSSFQYLQNKYKVDSNNNPISIFIPSSQLNKFSISDDNNIFIPPPNSDIFIINPYFGQIENYQQKLSKYYNNKIDSIHSKSKPRFWSLISNHLVTNGTFWDINHKGIGELKITYIPFNYIEASSNEIINSSQIIKQIFQTPTLLPIIYSYSNINLLLIEQMIIQSSISLINHIEFLPIYQNLKNNSSLSSENEIDIYFDKRIKLKKLIYDLINESVKVLKEHPIVKHYIKLTPTYLATLSEERLFNIVLNLIYSDKVVSSISNNINPLNEIIKRKKFVKLNLKENEKLNKKNESLVDKYNNNNNNNKSEYDNIIHLRDFAKFNRHISKLGSTFGIKTPKNKLVCRLLDTQNKV